MFHLGSSLARYFIRSLTDREKEELAEAIWPAVKSRARTVFRARNRKIVKLRSEHLEPMLKEEYEIFRARSNTLLWGEIDLSRLLNGDSVEIKVYKTVHDGVSIAEHWVVSNRQPVPVFSISETLMPKGSYITIAQIKGQPRTIVYDLYGNSL